MPINSNDLMQQIKEAQESGKNLDPGFYINPKPRANEDLNQALGVPKGTIINSVPMPSPDPNEMIDLPGVGKVRRGDIKGLKKGGHVQRSHEKINLKHCKVSTHHKNSKHKKCW